MDPSKPRVLVLSDVGAEALIPLLEKCGAEVHCVADTERAAARVDQQFFDVLFAEVTTPLDVSSLLSFRERWPDLPSVAFGSAPAEGVPLQALQAGALEYLPGPSDDLAVARALETALEHGARNSEIPSLAPFDQRILGASSQILAVRDAISRVAAGTASVFVRGETGTGKELVARAIHAASHRSTGPFVKVHAPGLPDALFESELFGYERGAFTGANARKPGRVELAENGTLFLDEVAELSPAMQAKLLRLVQDREYERLGGTRTLRADVRFVTATHRDVEHMIDTRAFREDLFYRLNVVTIWLPPLRARRDDIPLIARHYLDKFRSANHKPSLRMEQRAERLLQAQRWPGNVRQLVNFMERLVVMAQSDVIEVDDVLREFDEQAAFATQSVPRDNGHAAEEPAVTASEDVAAMADLRELDFAVLRSTAASSTTVRPLRDEVRRAERRALEKALHAAGGNRTKAARLLGVSRRTLYSKLEEHGVS
jgi:two-component system response regulator AtoC